MSFSYDLFRGVVFLAWFTHVYSSAQHANNPLDTTESAQNEIEEKNGSKSACAHSRFRSLLFP